MTGSLLVVAAATSGILGLILILSRLFGTRDGVGVGGVRPDAELRVVSRAAVGPRQGVAVVAVGGRRLLVSCGDGGVRLIHKLDDPDPEIRAEGGRELRVETAGPMSVEWTLVRRMDDPRWLRGGLGREARRGTGGFGRWLRRMLPILVLLAGFSGLAGLGIGEAAAQEPAFRTDQSPVPGFEVRLGGGEDDGGLQVSGPVGAVLLIGFMTLIPTLLLLTTSFTRVLIVLHLLRQALGAQAAPPAHLLSALALLLTGFIMAPTLSQVNQEALSPWMDGVLDEVEMLQTAAVPVRGFMLDNTREEDLAFFLDLWGDAIPEEFDELPFLAVAGAFVTSELRVAFQMGFALFLPFLVIDLVVASVLMSMGMFMLPPLMVSLPFKLLLFVLVDGWSLMVGSLIQSFQ